MARIRIELPGTSIMTCTIPIRITDINYGNHLGNNSVVEIIHEARMQLLNRHGFTELEAGGSALIMSELCVEFKSEAFYGDELTVKIFVGEISRVAFELFYLLSATRQGSPVIIALAKTGMVCYDYAEKKVAGVPASLKAILLEGTP
jgi:acyl-CoA thioester hydrolase